MAFALAIALHAILANSNEPLTLTTAQAVREWSFREGETPPPAKLSGVVTHVNPHVRDFFLSDDSAGVYIGISNFTDGLKQGDRVEVEGTVGRGTFAPFVDPTRVRVVGRGPLPDPEPFNLSKDDSRWLDGQYVQSYVFVRSVAAWKGYSSLRVVTSEGAGRVFVPGVEHLDLLKESVGRIIRVRGVCVPGHDEVKRQVTGRTYLYVQRPEDITMLAGQQPRLEPAPLADFLSGFSAGPHPSARPIVLQGVVTAVLDRHAFLLQDESAGLEVQLLDPADLAIGQLVTVNGFLNVEPSRIILERAAASINGNGPMPDVINAPLPLFSKKTFGRLIQTEAVVESWTPREQSFVINLRNGPERFQAILPQPLAELPTVEPESTVRVTGVAYTFANGEVHTELPAVVLRSTADIETIAPPPPTQTWWSGTRVLGVLAGSAASVALAGLWVWLLRRQVRNQTRDITAQFQREAELNESLRQARKLEAVGRLAGGIAHDFNNLLTVIIGNCELAAQSLRSGDPARELVTTACDAGERAAALTRQLLTFSRSGPVVLQPIDLNAAIIDIEKLLQRMIGQHIRLTVNCAPGLPAIRAESTLIHQILFNLAANARDAMPGGGNLTISTAAITNDQGGRVVRLVISDTGCGMDDETRARAFEPFFTTKDVGKGTGLGLATVYGTLATLNGVIQIDTAIGMGTTFTIDFPPLVASPEVRPDIAPPTPERRRARILLVDDEDSVREVCRMTLQMYGYTVLSASLPRAALDLATTSSETIDLVVTDLMMPEMNGHELAIEIRKTHPRTPILVVSGYPEEEVSRLLGDLRNVEVLSKPFTPLHLAIKIQDILEDLSPQPPSVYRAIIQPSQRND